MAHFVATHVIRRPTRALICRERKAGEMFFRRLQPRADDGVLNPDEARLPGALFEMRDVRPRTGRPREGVFGLRGRWSNKSRTTREGDDLHEEDALDLRAGHPEEVSPS